MDAIEALKTRRSVRDYEDEEVPREVLEDLVDCARLACTARNEQPWEFVVVTDREMRERIADITDYGKFIANAGACILVFCKDTKYYLEDGSAAVQNLLVAARAHGLGGCWVAGDKKPFADRLRRLMGAPEGLRLIAEVAIGYPRSVPSPAKRPLREVIHWERY